MRIRVVACAMLFGAALCSREVIAADAVDASSPFGASVSLKSGELATIAGTADVNMEVRAQNSSNVSNNSVSGNSQTGTIAFDSQSFQSLSGLALISANTGNNVAINASLNVNVALNP